MGSYADGLLTTMLEGREYTPGTTVNCCRLTPMKSRAPDLSEVATAGKHSEDCLWSLQTVRLGLA